MLDAIKYTYKSLKDEKQEYKYTYYIVVTNYNTFNQEPNSIMHFAKNNLSVNRIDLTVKHFFSPTNFHKDAVKLIYKL